MERSRFAHRVLLALGLSVVTIVVVLATYVGLFGAAPQAWLQRHLAPLVTIYRNHQGAIQLAILIIGTGVPAVTGSLAILKAFYYAEWSLPARLHELIEEAKTDHLDERPALLAYVRNPFKTDDFLVPAILANPLSQFLHMLGFSTIRFRARSYAVSVDVRAEEINALATKRQDVENRKVTGHLVRAEYFSALSRKLAVNTPEWREQISAALAEYRCALEIRDDDLDALEGAVQHMQLLSENPSELVRMLRKCVNSARKQNRPLQQARARRKIAEVEDALNTSKSWNAAREQLVVSQNLLRPIAIPGSLEEAEFAATLLLYGEVQLKRERFWSARDALNKAKALFHNMNNREEENRANDAIDRLNQASAGDEGPDLG